MFREICFSNYFCLSTFLIQFRVWLQKFGGSRPAGFGGDRPRTNPNLKFIYRWFAVSQFHNFPISFFKGIYDDTNMKPTCVQWTPKSEHHLLVGNQGGEIQLFDVRKPKECLFKNAMESGGKQVTRLKFSNDGLTFAVCSESFPVRVLTLDDKLSSIEAK
jgi:WD40 repeat protein